ncbi:hypothetical protein KY285_005174 [Solanum tuberosum]|nr:hypothetical protein KY284_005402 [Solanum tuberosum]KAH0752026.1 hypothetical protein KY285_005174 [Solanum tuberosum]
MDLFISDLLWLDGVSIGFELTGSLVEPCWREEGKGTSRWWSVVRRSLKLDWSGKMGNRGGILVRSFGAVSASLGSYIEREKMAGRVWLLSGAASGDYFTGKRRKDQRGFGGLRWSFGGCFGGGSPEKGENEWGFWAFWGGEVVEFRRHAQ